MRPAGRLLGARANRSKRADDLRVQRRRVLEVLQGKQDRDRQGLQASPLVPRRAARVGRGRPAHRAQRGRPREEAVASITELGAQLLRSPAGRQDRRTLSLGRPDDRLLQSRGVPITEEMVDRDGEHFLEVGRITDEGFASAIAQPSGVHGTRVCGDVLACIHSARRRPCLPRAGHPAFKKAPVLRRAEHERHGDVQPADFGPARAGTKATPGVFEQLPQSTGPAPTRSEMRKRGLLINIKLSDCCMPTSSSGCFWPTVQLRGRPARMTSMSRSDRSRFPEARAQESVSGAQTGCSF